MRNPGHSESNSLESSELIDIRLLDKSIITPSQSGSWLLDRNCIKSGRVKHFKPEIDSITKLLAKSPRSPTPDLESIRLEAVIGNYLPTSIIRNIDELLDGSDSLGSIQKIQWQDTLQQVWLNCDVSQLDLEVIFKIAGVAINLGHWGLAKDALYSVLEINSHKLSVYHNLAICEIATGDFDSALKAVDIALLLDKNHHPSQELKTELASIIQLQNQVPWYHEPIAQNQLLTITPIISFYASAFFEQYRDPEIAKLTQLPIYKDVKQVADWITQQVKEVGKATYAVVHQVWGFVGVVSMRIKQSLAYFYFWIGTDFQGLGFGQQATELLFKQAKKLGIKRIYTSTFCDNFRSQRALGKCRFENVKHPNDLGLNYYCRYIERLPASVGLVNELESLLDN
ncbi:GNAT family N-acetyltransferase [Aliikangiella coralliicola]|uniref:GNAT family N-acetyltransferase n=1 Tax=Aliikangiella coralliicola TaxID=2592383 RepID=A0A545UCR5_9GAMM|nr:GNAT family N-acetyltransferase [Aliikangiella coralliicola]TQV87257.1 GNAT family N-acetyltransferase [Aliikangiella coralliicola]